MKRLVFSALTLIAISPAFAKADNRYVEACMIGANGDESLRPYCRCLYGKASRDAQSTMSYCAKKYIFNKNGGK